MRNILFYLFNNHKNIRTYEIKNMRTRRIIPYRTILITGLSLVRKINILLWVCKTRQVYILHARHTFPSVVYIFFECTILILLFCSYIFALSFDWATVFVKILFTSSWNYTLPCRLLISWYLFFNYIHFCFPNLEKMFFVLTSALNVLIVLIFQSISLSF